MPSLRQLLESTPYPLLCVIARQRDLTVPHNCPKADLVDTLDDALAIPERLQVTLEKLSPAELSVLEDLRLAGGRLPRYHLARRHGDLRRYRPWQEDAPPRPWENPQSPTERLYFLGLIFWEKATRDLVIPDELLALYPTPDRAKLARSEGPEMTAYPSAMLAAHDMAQFLARLDITQTRLLHGRWLPLRFLRAWGQHCLIPPANAEARSELQTERRRFLHFLAEATGLAARVGPLLKPTPTAWVWLGMNPLARFGMLWDGLIGASAELWRIHRLPGHDLLRYPLLIEAVLRALRQDVADALDELDGIDQAAAPAPEHFPEISFGTPESFAQRLLARDPEPRSNMGERILNADELLAETLAALVEGPLCWLGALEVAPAGDLQLTAWGAHWLCPWAPALETSPVASFHLEPGLIFAPPDGLPDLLDLATLTACGERLADDRFRITPASLVAALQRGHELPMLLERLNHIAQRPLSGGERAELSEWAAAADRMVIRRLTVLEVEDPAILARLSGARRGRKHILSTLGRRVVAVDEGRLPVLVRRLTRQEGMPPRVEVPPQELLAAPASEASLRASLGRGGAAHLWLAAKVYRALGQLIDLPAHLPHELLELLAALAEPGSLTAADVAFERTIEALQNAIIGRAAFPVWTEVELPVEESVALIEEALAQGHALEMDYYSAGREVLTHRVVEPQRLEYRGETVYLIGFCRRAQAERVFRVDRIRTLELVPIPQERYTGWDL